MEIDRKASVLVIDDDDFLRKLCRIVLEEAGYEVHLAAHGAEGLKLLELHAIDLVICDMFMPEMDGIETILALRRQSRPCKVIAISGVVGGLPDMLPTAKHLGAVRALQKPFSPADLAEAVRSMLESDE